MVQSILPRFCLIAPEAGNVAVHTGLEPALASGLVEAVILPVTRLPEGAVEYGVALAALATRHGVALLVVDDVAIAGEIGAGVVFTAMPEDLKPVRARLGGDAIVGIITAATRHEGMQAAQAGTDFVGLGEFGGVAGAQELDDLDDLLAWWDEMIEIPSVAFGADTPEVAARMLKAGADSVALGAALWGTKAPAKTLRAIAEMAAPEK